MSLDSIIFSGILERKISKKGGIKVIGVTSLYFKPIKSHVINALLNSLDRECVFILHAKMNWVLKMISKIQRHQTETILKELGRLQAFVRHVPQRERKKKMQGWSSKKNRTKYAQDYILCFSSLTKRRARFSLKAILFYWWWIYVSEYLFNKTRDSKDCWDPSKAYPLQEKVF